MSLSMFGDDRLPRRFWNKVSPDPVTGCWLWTAYTTPKGYGQFGVGGRTRIAHRLVYEVLVGEILDGLVTDHLCRVRCCVNPAHIEPVTNQENVLRGLGPTAANARKAHCKRGHEFTSENTYRDRKGRRCRTCGRESLARKQGERRREGLCIACGSPTVPGRRSCEACLKYQREWKRERVTS